MRSMIGRLSLALWCLGAASCSNGDLGFRVMGHPTDTPAQTEPTETATFSGTAALSVHLVDGPLDGLEEVNVDLERLSILTENGTETQLSQPGTIVNLLKLQDGVSQMIAQSELVADRYTQLRLQLGGRNSLKLSDGSFEPLRIPSGSQSGLKINIDMGLAAGSTQDVFIDFDVAESLHLQMSGPVPRFMLRPVLRGVVKQQSGALAGALMNDIDDQPLGNVEVLAERRSADGEPVVVRRTRTNVDGHYRLDLLPFGKYVVVAQPVVAGRAFEVKVSEPIQLTAQKAQSRYDAQVAPAGTQGSLRVRVMTAAEDHQGDLCLLYSGTPDAPVIVSTSVPQVADLVEFAQFGPLPTGDYFAKCLRRSVDGSGMVYMAASLVSSLTVTSGENQVEVWF